MQGVPASETSAKLSPESKDEIILSDLPSSV